METVDTVHSIAVMVISLVGIWAFFELTKGEDD